MQLKMKQFIILVSCILAYSLAHEVYSDGILTDSSATTNTFDFFSTIHSQSRYLFFTMPSCSHCETMKVEWDKLEIGKEIEQMEIDCTKQDQYQICQFFGIQRLPTVILTKQGSYYFLPGSINLRQVSHLQAFVESEYQNAFIWGELVVNQATLPKYYNQARRIFQNMMEENANGLSTLGITSPNRVFLTIFTFGFLAFPFGLIYFILQWYCDKAQGPAQEQLRKKEKELSELKLSQKKAK